MASVRRVPGLVLLATVLTISLFGLEVGREMPVTTLSTEPAPGLRFMPKIASNGDGYLVVWHDRRGNASEVRASRVDRDGAVLDPESILIATSSGAAISVASDGHDYLVSYSCNYSNTPGVCISRVGAENGVALRAAAIEGRNGALASHGDGYVLVYQSGPVGSEQPVLGLALDAEGVAAGAAFPIASSSFAPVVAAGDGGYFVVWSTYEHLQGVLVSDTAVVGSPQRMTAAAPSWGPGPFSWSVTSSGSGFLVAWQQNTGVVNDRYTTEIRVAGIDASGVAGTARAVAGANAWQPELAATGSGMLLVFTHSTSPASAPYLQGDANGDVRAMALTAAGEPESEAISFAESAGRESAPAVASIGLSTLVVWQNVQRPEAALIEGRLAGAPDAFVISTSAAWQANVTISRDQLRTLVAFEETAAEQQLDRVVLHQYEANVFFPLGRETFTVQSSTHHQRRPAVEGNLIAWVEEDPNGPDAWVWWQPLGGYTYGSNYGPAAPAERIEMAARGTRLAVFKHHVFHAVLWTAPDGRLKGVYKQLLTRLGFDESTFYVTADTAINPSTDGYAPLGTALVAYNHEIPPQGCPGFCTPRHSVRATVVGRSIPRPEIDIAPAGASAPRVVYQHGSGDYFIFWSMEDGGTYVQRVDTRGGAPVAVGEARKVHDGTLHDASVGEDGEFFVVVAEAGRFALLRFSAQFDVLENAPFHARLAGDSPISISGRYVRPMMAYPAREPNDGASSRAVLRLTGDDAAPPRRRAVR